MVSFISYAFLISLLNPYGSTLQAPEIKVQAWIEGESGAWRDDVVIGDQEGPVALVNRSTYILSNEIVAVIYLCIAPYPTEWAFSHAEWFRSHKKSTGGLILSSRRIATDLKNSRTFNYWSEIGLVGDPNLFTGTYVCKKTDDASLQNNITVFWEGGALVQDTVFVLSGSNISVWLDSSDKIIFPCYVRDPYAEVVLLQDIQIAGANNTANDTWNPIPLSPKLSFKPEIGFILKTQSNDDDWPVPGMYKCATKDGTDSLLVNYIPKYKDQSTVAMNAPITSSASLKFIPSSRPLGSFECCSSSSRPPRIDVMGCENPSMCNMFQSSFKKDEIRKDGSELNGVLRINGSCVSYLRGWGSGQADLSLVRCVGDGINVARDFFMRNPENIPHHEWDSNALQKWVHIDPAMPMARKLKLISKDDIYEVYSGQPTTFNCKARPYFFSYGIRWTLQFKDGTVETMPDTFGTVKQTPILVLLPTQSIESPVTIKGTKNLDSLTCHVPVWNSSDWVTKTVKLSVKESIPSAIENPEMESVFWALNETDRSLTCKISGDPDPKVIWMKDNKLGSSMLYNFSRHPDGSSVLRIPRVTHEIQGEFKCIAINFVSRSEKTFTVYVEESQVAKITTTIFATLIVLLLLTGGIILIKKTMFQKKSLDNLRESVYRPEQSAAN